jgi:hypothetical protein
MGSLPDLTAYISVAVWPPTSVATTEVHDVPFRTASVQLNDPVPLVVKASFVQLVIDTLSKTTQTVGDIEKPVPDGVTVVPGL